MPFPLPLIPSDGSAPLVLNCPTCWQDVSFAQFVALLAPTPGDERTAAELLCGLPAGGLADLSVDSVGYIANLIGFAQDPSDVLALLPTPGLKTVGELPFGTLLLAQQHMAAEPDRPALAHMPYVLALYRTQLLYGKYLEGKVAACLAALLAAPCTEVYADAAFFFSGLARSRNSTPPTPTTTPSPTTKSTKPGSSGFLRSLGLFSASTPPPKATS